jgi:hypothetical protein
MIIRVNFGFHGRSFGAPAPAFSISKGGFGPLYSAASPAKQAKDTRIMALSGVQIAGFASAGREAYLRAATR